MTHIDVERVRWLIGQVGVAANAINGSRGASDESGSVAASAFGNTASGSFCHTAWQETATEASTATGFLRTSLEADWSRLGVVLHTFEQMDAESADEICATGLRSGSLDVFNTHLDSKSGDRRQEQAEDAVNAIEPALGPTIFAGDFNTETPPELDRLTGVGWVEVSVDADGNPLATSSHDNAIDKVYASPGVVATGPAEEVDGGPSDHDGIVVNLAIAPAWP